MPEALKNESISQFTKPRNFKDAENNKKDKDEDEEED